MEERGFQGFDTAGIEEVGIGRLCCAEPSKDRSVGRSMDAKTCWMVSTAIHGVLLLGAATLAVDHFVFGDGEGSGFSCRLGDPTVKFDRIERPKDLFGSRIPSAEESGIAEAYAPVGSSGNDQERWSDCCVCGCDGAATALVAWPRDIMSYFDRK
ncbi:MAG TPA: hypothetical protein VKU80_15855, partial [Planctomycetota bacterium]|nr:hypothetical protein [Planctomycetota bacterium]